MAQGYFRICSPSLIHLLLTHLTPANDDKLKNGGGWNVAGSAMLELESNEKTLEILHNTNNENNIVIF